MRSPLFEAVPDALLVVDPRGRIVWANGNAGRLFGYAVGELIGMPVEALMPANVRARHRHHLARYADAPRVRAMGQSEMSLVGLRKDGSQFPLDVALSPFTDEAGPRYLASIRDISETRPARQAVARARHDIAVDRISQVALATGAGDAMLDALPHLLAEALAVPTVVVVLADRVRPVVRASVGLPGKRAWSTFAATSLRRMLHAHMVQVVTDRAHAPAGWPAAAASGAIVPLPDPGDRMVALVAMAPSAGRFDHDAVQLLQTAANLVAAALRRRRAEAQLAHAQRLDAVGQLVGGIAHDFNNLLTVMSGNLQLLEFTADDPQASRELLQSALRSVERGSELTAKLLAFARRQQLEPRAIDPAVVLHDLGVLLRRTLGGAVRLRMACPAGLPWVFADPAQLDSALVNLALNARDAMPRGGEIRIDASLRRGRAGSAALPGAAGFVAFRVSDDGQGMSAEVLARAFEPFFTTKPAGRGSGLRLSMVQGFAQESGGQVKIRSRPGHGTRVELLLPVAPARGPARLQPADDTRGRETLLVVEDEREVRKVAANMLRSLGYRVLLAANAASALERLRRHEGIALLFSDVMLGEGMSGIELARAARHLRPGLPVLLASGCGDEGAGDAASPGTASGILRKPYRREQLARAVRARLSVRPAT